MSFRRTLHEMINQSNHTCTQEQIEEGKRSDRVAYIPIIDLEECQSNDADGTCGEEYAEVPIRFPEHHTAQDCTDQEPTVVMT